ncbi:Cof-type HAD-IIB family hydrolase [Lactobacillus hamsteri]|uniref:HAD superfamily hydrolase n=1 Tax=Lactobacillus hamsteri DSM 5661 = JCM 6256 TaxID=1423754 RepID=A0A0R1YK09_9LACO|nr:Cof-type HAD-IIB family hydrolase [Lactobacillus hamsteri]KRM40201.1 HAD superfamily hydrolase [Lactobacillus hamsteri DSM 5661 = JCM 6256]
MTIKMIAVDLDGTLLNSHHQIDEKTVIALQKANKLGIKVVPASGRPLPGVLPYLEKLKISGQDNYAIVFNGALVQNLTGKTIINHNMNYDDLKYLLDVQKLSKSNLHFMCEKFYYTLDHDFSLTMSRVSYLSGMPFKVREFDQIATDFTFLKGEYTGTKKEMDLLGRKLSNQFKQDYNVARSDREIWEINKKSASKGNAIHELAQKLNIDDQEVIIFGDQGNDLSMFSRPDFLKVAMGNAIDEIKEKANFVTADNDHNGIAEALDKFVF